MRRTARERFTDQSTHKRLLRVETTRAPEAGPGGELGAPALRRLARMNLRLGNLKPPPSDKPRSFGGASSTSHQLPRFLAFLVVRVVRGYKFSTPAPKLSADKAHILRSIAGHIVAGTATDIERKQLDSLLAVLGKQAGSFQLCRQFFAQHRCFGDGTFSFRVSSRPIVE